MPFVATVLSTALLLAYLRGGSIGRLADVRLRWVGVLFAALGLQAAVPFATARGWLGTGDAATAALLAASQLLTLAWAVGNRSLPGMRLVALGVALNAVVTAANGAMPVDPAAVRALGGDPSAPQGAHTPLTGSSRLPWLADIWALPPLRSIVSVGDVVLAAGLGRLLHTLMTARPAPTVGRGRSPAEADDSDATPTP